MKVALGVILGYVVSFTVVFVGLTAMWFALGESGAFQEGTYNVTTTWIAASIVVGLIAAFLAGKTCRAIGKTDMSVNILAGVVLLLGAGMAVAAMSVSPPEAVREPPTAMGDAMMKAVTPAWVAILNPIIGVIGVMLGGRAPASATRNGGGDGG